MQAPQLVGGAATSPRDGVALEIKERLSQELVIALVGPIASGVSSAAGFLRQILQGDFGYDVSPIMKPSDVIRAQSALIDMAPPERRRTATYVTDMQEAGNRLRKKFGNNYLIEKLVERIRTYRTENAGSKARTKCPVAAPTSSTRSRAWRNSNYSTKSNARPCAL